MEAADIKYYTSTEMQERKSHSVPLNCVFFATCVLIDRKLQFCSYFNTWL